MALTMSNPEFWLMYSMSNAAMPAATRTADEVPFLSSVRDSLLETLAPDTATPKALYFSTPLRYEVNSARFPFPSAAPIQEAILRLAGNVIGSLAPEFDADAKMIMPFSCAFNSAYSISGIERLNPQEMEMISQ